MLDGLEVDLLSNVGREVDEVLLVQIRDDDMLNMVSMGGQSLLLQASYGKDPSSQSDLARHGHVFFDRGTGESRNKGYSHRNASRGSILWDGACGDMNVDLLIIEVTRFDAIGSPS